MHGFDEFFGNLYHLNAEEEPESPNWPPADDFPGFNERFRPRGVLHSWATDEDDATEDPRYGRVGPAADRGHRAADAASGWRRSTTRSSSTRSTSSTARPRRTRRSSCWFNTTHMHFRTHPKPESVGQAGRWQSPYHDTMIDHDKVVGALLDKLDELGLADDTIVDLQHRQRAAHEHLARRRHDAVPQREEHQLGGRLPRPGDDPLARQDPRRRRSPTRSSSTTTGCRPSSPPPASPTSSTSSRPATRSATRPTRSTSTATTCCPT